jgi:predicted ATPase with chaperone activity
MKRADPIHAAAVLVAGSLLCAAAANAQAPSPSAEPQQAQSPSTPSADIPDQKLDATAAAVQRVASLRQDFQNRIATAAPSDKERIADEANSAMAKAVTDQGLSVEEYTAILQLAQADPAVRDKIRKRLPASK